MRRLKRRSRASKLSPFLRLTSTTTIHLPFYLKIERLGLGYKIARLSNKVNFGRNMAVTAFLGRYLRSSPAINLPTFPPQQIQQEQGTEVESRKIDDETEPKELGGVLPWRRESIEVRYSKINRGNVLPNKVDRKAYSSRLHFLSAVQRCW